MPAGEAPIKQAVKWIEDQLVDRPQADRVKLVDEASRRFDLTPLDEEFLYRQLVAAANFLETDGAATHRIDHHRLAPGDPAFCVARWQVDDGGADVP